MTIVKPTLKHILLIWLSITLRALVWGIAAAFAAAILISIAVAVTGATRRFAKPSMSASMSMTSARGFRSFSTPIMTSWKRSRSSVRPAGFGPG